MGKFNDLTGRRFSRLLVLGIAGKDENGCIRWLCQCDCGKQKTVYGLNLTRGFSKSCGCLQKERAAESSTGNSWSVTHGCHRTPEYVAWQGIIQRCLNPNNKSYDNYGGRGIQVCDRWVESFEKFLADMGEKPEPKELYSIDRINNDGDYEPSNCRWATRDQQLGNQRFHNQYTKEGFYGTTIC
jgi:hypothetical protein